MTGEVIVVSGLTEIASGFASVPTGRSGMTRSQVYLVAIAVIVATPSLVRSADKEQRVFAVTVDGKPAGEYRMTITVDDGWEQLTCSAAVRVKHLVGQYRYSYHGTEIWRGGRLQQLDAASDDDGIRHTVRAVTDLAGLHVTVDGKAQPDHRPGAWPTTYYRLPDGAKSATSLSLLDVDTGKVLAVRLSLVGQAKVTIADRPMDCTHYRVSGQAQAELWFDAPGRLVREETVEDGHKTVLELASVQKVK